MPFELTVDNAATYLAGQGLVELGSVRSVEALGWGVSNTLVKVRADRDCLVLKQSLARLRVSEDWFADRVRIQRERACIDVLSVFLPAGTLPAVRHEDRANYLLVMSCAPEGGVNWKEQLLAGQVDPAVAARVGALLGRIHRQTAGNPELLAAFGDDRCFVQLRIDPYHRTTARAHPALAGALHQEARRMLAVKQTLVHGDYSPKNFIVNGREVFLLDFEVAHYGNPVFDLAFLLSHLYLKSIHLAAWRDRFHRAADSFWGEYLRQLADPVGLAPGWDLTALERDTIKQLGCLMLARVDGKSPVEYIQRREVKDLVRAVAGELLLGSYASLREVTRLIDRRVQEMPGPAVQLPPG